METVRVAFVEVPRLLQDLSAGLFARESGIDVHSYELDLLDVPGAVAAGEVEVLVAGSRLAEPEQICKLLMSYPRLKALVVIDQGRRAAFFELRPNADTCELSPQTLIDVVKASSRECASELGDLDLDSARDGEEP